LTNSEPNNIAPTSYARRFGGVARAYGDAGLTRLQQSHVCVIGIGGVGAWAVEALARSGVGKITMIDMDIVAESNINRQLHALTDTVGRDKGLVMQERILQINAHCEVVFIDEFLSRENLPELITANFDFVIDGIDDFRLKAALIHHAKKQHLRLITIGGAGGQSDPLKIRQTDLSRTQHDVLLAKTRKLLRQDYGFPRNPKRSFSVPCIYSDEQLRYPDGQGGLSAQRPASGETADRSNALNCAGGLGSLAHVTASFGFFAAGYVLNSLVGEHNHAS
jgi:tRNA A37 threonylcarbamoyladenosine dehydratase